MLDTRWFGKMLPSRNWPMVFDAPRHHFAQRLPERLREVVDLSIKDRMRLWRLANTIHEKSQLYKTLLTPADLEKLNGDEIRVLAKKPRPLTSTDETGLLSRVEVEENRAVGELLRRIQRQFKTLTRKRSGSAISSRASATTARSVWPRSCGCWGLAPRSANRNYSNGTTRTPSSYLATNSPAWSTPPASIASRTATVVGMPCSDATLTSGRWGLPKVCRK